MGPMEASLVQQYNRKEAHYRNILHKELGIEDEQSKPKGDPK